MDANSLSLTYTPQGDGYGGPVVSGPTRPTAPVFDRLSTHITQCLTSAQSWHTTQILPKIEKSRRQRAGEFEADKAAALAEYGGSKAYNNITDAKCAALVAWLLDTLLPADDKAWAIKPTPIPTLPPEVMDEITQESVAAYLPVLEEAQLAAAQNPAYAERILDDARRYIQSQVLDEYDMRLKRLVAESTKRAARQEQIIEDQLIEGAFKSALFALFDDLPSSPIAILKGPVFKTKRVQVWGPNGTSIVQDRIIYSFERVSPSDFFPSPTARDVQDDYVCERKYYNVRDVDALRAAPGWIASEIDLVLKDFRQSRTSTDAQTAGDSERALAENRATYADANATTIEAIEWWGTVPGADLLEWNETHPVDLRQYGFDAIDSDQWYDVTAVRMRNRIVRLAKNPDPLGKRPYSVVAFEPISGSLYGRDVCEKMRDAQDGFGACIRGLVNTLAITSGPMMSYDESMLPPGTAKSDIGIKPWGVYFYNGQTAGGSRKPVEFFQPQSFAGEFMNASELFASMADNQTGIPRYVHGDADVSGAGKTASGLGMLMGAASKVLKRLISHIDGQIIEPTLSRLIAFNNAWGTDEALKGDVNIVPRGALALAVKEQINLRRMEFFSATRNPMDFQIMGIAGRTALLREIARGLDIPVDDLVPDLAELEQRTKDSMTAQGDLMNPLGDDGGAPAIGNTLPAHAVDTRPNPNATAQVPQ